MRAADVTEPSSSSLLPVEYTFPYRLAVGAMSGLVLVLAIVWWMLPDRVTPPARPRIPPASSQQSTQTDRIDLNRASMEELCRVRGIAEATARKIMDRREREPFDNVDQLLEEKIVMPRYFEDIKKAVTVGQ